MDNSTPMDKLEKEIPNAIQIPVVEPEKKYMKVLLNKEYMIDLTKACIAYAYNPEDAELNFWLALKYDEAGQTASSFSYYLRCAERTTDDNLAYECLLKMGICFERQGRRGNSARGAFQHAMCLMPSRPEAYYLLARHYEKIGDHPSGYMYAEQALQLANFNQTPLHTWVEYPGKWALIFQKMVCSWWWGKPQECRDLLQELKTKYRFFMDQAHWNATQNNLNRLGAGPESMVYRTYFSDQYTNLRYRFPGSESVMRNWSQVYQDMFVLSMLNGKTAGTYLEIGSAGPENGNNTKLLEEGFGWTGVGIEWDVNFCNEYRKRRKNPVLQEDALKIDYTKLLGSIAKNGVVDYLQLDCEPASTTYEIMTKIPFDKFKFAVITYEHDDYVDMTQEYRQKSRDFLRSKGYVMVVSDVSPDGISNFEDWWVLPELTTTKVLTMMKNTSPHTKHASEYMLPGFTRFAPTAFDYGQIAENEWFLGVLDAEMFRGLNLYERFFEVEKGDIVFDLGASVGPFSYCVKNRNPSTIICVEPHPELFKTLRKNLVSRDVNIILENIAIGPVTGDWDTTGLFDKDQKNATDKTTKVKSIRFDEFIKDRVDHIDFLKLDIEGAEYDIFTEENKEWILQSVRKVAGEFHLNTQELKNKFRKFRDTYLKEFDNSKIQVFSSNLIDIKWDLWNDHFIDFYSEITLYVDNRK